MWTFLAWLILFVLCWPLALLALVLYPLVWLVALPVPAPGLHPGGGLRDAQGGPLPAGPDARRPARLRSAWVPARSASCGETVIMIPS